MRIIQSITLFAAIVGQLSGVAWAGDEIQILREFIRSDNLILKENAYRKIVNNSGQYTDLIFGELQRLGSKDTTRPVPDSLLYLAMVIKNDRFVEPLARLIENQSYSAEACIYDCPIVLALAIYDAFTTSGIPSNLNDGITAVSDLRNLQKHIKQKFYLKTDSIYIMNPEMRNVYEQTQKLPIVELLEQARPGKSYVQRMIAAHFLSNNIMDDKHIVDLYWLAITEAKDASAEYRAAIYKAILRAEDVRSISVEVVE